MTDFEIEPLRPSLAPSVEVLAGDICDDEQAITIFLDSYSRRSKHTLRSYHKECRRFLLWIRAAKASSAPSLLPAVTVEDMNRYLDFLSAPRAFDEKFLAANGWKHQPFRKALDTESVKHTITVLHKMFDALRHLRTRGNQPYCLFNPLKLAHQSIAGNHNADDEIEEALNPKEWESILDAVELLSRDSERERKHYHRARWVMQLLYRAFLRRSEAASLTMGSFEPSTDGWNIRLVGKGNKKAKIVATEKLIEELKIYRTSLGLSPLPLPGETRPAVLAVTGKDRGISDQAIYLLCKTIFEKASLLLSATDPLAASRLKSATPHWMRHTGVTHAMEAGINPRYVQAQARHSSLNVTARYDHKARKGWRKDLERM